jgi:hypothetical protein
MNLSLEANRKIGTARQPFFTVNGKIGTEGIVCVIKSQKQWRIGAFLWQSHRVGIQHSLVFIAPKINDYFI